MGTLAAFTAGVLGDADAADFLTVLLAAEGDSTQALSALKPGRAKVIQAVARLLSSLSPEAIDAVTKHCDSLARLGFAGGPAQCGAYACSPVSCLCARYARRS